MSPILPGPIATHKLHPNVLRLLLLLNGEILSKKDSRENGRRSIFNVDVKVLYILAQAAAGYMSAGVKALSFSSTLTDRVVGFAGVLVAPSTGAQSRG